MQNKYEQINSNTILEENLFCNELKIYIYSLTIIIFIIYTDWEVMVHMCFFFIHVNLYDLKIIIYVLFFTD